MTTPIKYIKSDGITIDNAETVGQGPLVELLGYSSDDYINLIINTTDLEQNLVLPNGELRIGSFISVPVTSTTNGEYLTIMDSDGNSHIVPLVVNNVLDYLEIPVTINTVYTPSFNYLSVPLPPNDFFAFDYIGGDRVVYNFPSQNGLGTATPHNNLGVYPDGIMTIDHTDFTFDINVGSEPVIPIRAYLYLKLYEVPKYRYGMTSSDTREMKLQVRNPSILSGGTAGNPEVIYLLDTTKLIHRIPLEPVIAQNISPNTLEVTCINTDEDIAMFIEDCHVELFYMGSDDYFPCEYRYCTEDNNDLKYYRVRFDLSDNINSLATTNFPVPDKIEQSLLPKDDGSYVSKVYVNSSGVFQYIVMPEDIIQVWRFDCTDVGNENTTITTSNRTIYQVSDITKWENGILIATIYNGINKDGDVYLTPSAVVDDVISVGYGSVSRYYYKIERFSTYVIYKVKLPFQTDIVGGEVTIVGASVNHFPEIIYTKSLLDGRDRQID